jgi:cell cycle sensor histidine kinase DivJ
VTHRPIEHPKSTDLAVLSHELRTPLNALIGYADAMRGQVFGPLPAPYDEHARIMHRAALHLLALVDDLASATREGERAWPHKPEPIDLSASVEEVVSLMRPRAAALGLEILTDVDATPGAVMADRRSMTQILVNLMDNALKFTGPGGRIVLTIGRRGDRLEIVVSDSGAATGVGAGAKGQGLGLEVARALCAAHGGSLTLGRSPHGGFEATASLAVIEDD